MQPSAPSTQQPFNGIAAASFTSMLQAVNGLRNRRALVAWLGCAIVGVLASGLIASLSGALGFLAVILSSIVFLIALGTGVNAAGLLQMDQARGVPLRSLSDALVYGLMCIPKLVVLGLAFFAVTLVFFIALALIFLVCKIPFVGPMLYAVVFPLAVVAAGLLITGVFVCMLLSLPAIWEGSPISRALAQTLAIAKSRMVETLLLFAIVGVICVAVAFIVFGVIFNGLVPVMALSGGILGMGGFGGGGGGGSALESMTMMSQGGGGMGYIVAGGIGFGILWSVAAALVGQVYLHGLNLVYLRVTEKLDVGAAEAALQRTFDEARQRSGELAAKARAATAPTPAAAVERAAEDERSSAAAAAAAAASYGGHANSPPAYSPPPTYSPPPPVFPPSVMASPPAYAAPPTTPSTFDIPPPAMPAPSMPAAASSMLNNDLPGAVTPSSLLGSPEPLDLEFDFDMPGTSAAPAPPPASSSDPVPTMPLRGARESLSASTSVSAAPVVPPFPPHGNTGRAARRDDGHVPEMPVGRKHRRRVLRRLREPSQMNGADFEAATLALAEARLNSRTIASWPHEWLPADIDEAYRLQRAVADRLGPTRGWKIAAVTEVQRKNQGLASPISAGMLAPWFSESPAVWPRARYIAPLLECEFAFELGADLPPRDAPYSRDEVAAATRAMRIGLELVDPRLPRGLTVAAELADAFNNGGYVVGPATTDWHRINFFNQGIVLYATDPEHAGEIARGSGRAILDGDLFEAVVMMANSQPRLARGLQRGDIVTTGTCTGAVPAVHGKGYEADFGELGKVSLRLD